jgi:hypothetical protein
MSSRHGFFSRQIHRQTYDYLDRFMIVRKAMQFGDICGYVIFRS